MNDTTRPAPFDIRNGRAMVSLGPLSRTRYCSYKCPFCYVSGGFPSYASMSVGGIISWLRDAIEPFNIIYVSGDTDSFAPPRTDLAILLLEELCQFDVDILFTTRSILSHDHLARLSELNNHLRSKGHFLIGCVSITQWSVPCIEPSPIPKPQERVFQLHQFTDLGLVSVLALRPFLPNIPLTDYTSIVRSCSDAIDVVLGESWYVDSGGLLFNRTLITPTLHKMSVSQSTMDFDSNDTIWQVCEIPEVESLVRAECQSIQIPFFMRSAPAIQWVRQNVQLP